MLPEFDKDSSLEYQSLYYYLITMDSSELP